MGLSGPSVPDSRCLHTRHLDKTIEKRRQGSFATPPTFPRINKKTANQRRECDVRTSHPDTKVVKMGCGQGLNIGSCSLLRITEHCECSCETKGGQKTGRKNCMATVPPLPSSTYPSSFGPDLKFHYFLVAEVLWVAQDAAAAVDDLRVVRRKHALRRPC